jgi:uncharacterized protein YuzE
MKDRYLEVTFRKGKPLAAYLYLPRQPGEKSARTENAGAGILIDYSASGRPIGIEITAPLAVTPVALNAVLARTGVEEVAPEDLAPLRAA